MKKSMIVALAALVVAAGAAAAKEVKTGKRDCAGRPEHGQAGAKKCANKMCPEAMDGVETAARNTPDGIEITMTARNAETISKLQELTLVHYTSKETMEKDCPSRVEGAVARIENTSTGVKVYITGKTLAHIKKIQAAAAKDHSKAGCPEEHGKKEAKASKKYACPMKCAESDKPGKCQKCGMNMTVKK